MWTLIGHLDWKIPTSQQIIFFFFFFFFFQIQPEAPVFRDTRLEDRKRLFLRPTYLTESPDTQYDTGTWARDFQQHTENQYLKKNVNL